MVTPAQLAGAMTVATRRRARQQDPGAAVAPFRSVITGLREVPNDGLDYGLLRYVGRVPELAAEPQIQFSYLGRLDLGGAADRPWSLLTERYLDARLIDPEPDLPLPFAVHISSFGAATPDDSQPITDVRWSDALFAPTELDALTHLWQRSVAALAERLGAGDHPLNGFVSHRRSVSV
jgi:mycobactin peptide synthetase MbtF